MYLRSNMDEDNVKIVEPGPSYIMHSNSGTYQNIINQGAQIKIYNENKGHMTIYQLPIPSNQEIPSQYGLPTNLVPMIGREAELKKLADSFKKNHRLAIVGMGGLGKTTLAYNLAKQWMDNQKSVFIINSETTNSIISSIQGLAAHLDIKNINAKPVITLAQEIFNLLKNRYILFIYDNVELFSDIREYLPPKDNSKYCVLFTSQNHNFDDFEIFKLKILNHANSIKLIENKLNKQLWDTEEKMKDVNQLVITMMGLPLGILQAVSYINHKFKCSFTYSVKKYLDTYTDHMTDSKRKTPYSSSSEDLYKKTVYWAVSMNIELMQKDENFPEIDSYVINTLYTLPFLNHEGVDIKLLLPLLEISEDILGEVINLLTTYSICEKSIRLNGTYLTTHRLILYIIYKLLDEKCQVDKKYILVNAFKTILEIILEYYWTIMLGSEIFNIHKKFILPDMTHEWFYEACSSAFKSVEYRKGFTKCLLKVCSDVNFINNVTVYHYAAYLRGSELFINLKTSAPRNMSCDVKSLEDVYNERKSLAIINVYEQSECVISANDGKNLVDIADTSNNYHTVRRLVFGGASATSVVNVLNYALKSCDVEFLRALLNNGAKVNVVDEGGWTPLHYAVDGGSIECVSTLLNHGANVNVLTNDGETLLHIAAKNESVECVSKLLSMGLDINQVDSNGSTPLHFAVWHGYVNVVRELLQKGANAIALDNSGNTPLQILNRVKLKLCHPDKYEYIMTEIPKIFQNHLIARR